MTRFVRAVLACALLGTIPMTSWAQSSENFVAQRPQLAVGKSWTLQDNVAHVSWTETITAVTPETITVQRSTGLIIVWDRDLNHVSAIGPGMNCIFKKDGYGPYPLLQFPLVAGKQWTDSYKSCFTGNVHTVKHTVSVDTLTINGQQRNVFKVVALHRRDNNGATGEETAWYDPTMGLIVRLESASWNTNRVVTETPP